MLVCPFVHVVLNGFVVDDKIVVLLEHDRDAARVIRRLVGVITCLMATFSSFSELG